MHRPPGRRLYVGAKMLLPPNRPVETGVAAKSKSFETALQQMLRRQLRDLLVVGFDPRQFRHNARRAYVDRGHPRAYHRGRDTRRLDARDDPIAIPPFQPIGGVVAPALLHQVKRPRLMLPDVVHHPLQQTPGVSVRRFDQQRHLPTAGRMRADRRRRHSASLRQIRKKSTREPLDPIRGLTFIAKGHFEPGEKTHHFCVNSHGRPARTVLTSGSPQPRPCP